MVVGPAASLRHLPQDATVIVDRAGAPSEAAALRAAVDYAQRSGADALVVAFGDAWPRGACRRRPGELAPASAEAPAGEIVVGTVGRRPAGLVRLVGRRLAAPPPRRAGRPAVRVPGRSSSPTVRSTGPGPPPGAQHRRPPAAAAPRATRWPPADLAAVTALLGRPPAGGFRVVVRDAVGGPVVIRNAPFLDDGTPMPTTYWLVGRAERELVGRLEAAGGVRRAEARRRPSGARRGARPLRGRARRRDPRRPSRPAPDRRGRRHPEWA